MTAVLLCGIIRQNIVYNYAPHRTLFSQLTSRVRRSAAFHVQYAPITIYKSPSASFCPVRPRNHLQVTVRSAYRPFGIPSIRPGDCRPNVLEPHVRFFTIHQHIFPKLRHRVCDFADATSPVRFSERKSNHTLRDYMSLLSNIDD